MTNKILLVDDEKGVVDVMKDYFQLSGYQVMTAYSGTEALTKFKDSRTLFCWTSICPILTG